MDPFSGAAIAGTIGSVASSAWNWLTGRENRNWQEKMANTAYQRSTADMRAAGLNPSMMYGSGSAAMTPNPAPTAPASNPVQGVPELALSAARLSNETRVSEATAGKLSAEEAAIRGYHGVKAEAETGLARAHTVASESELKNIIAKLDEIKADTRLKNSSAAKVEAETPKQVVIGKAYDTLQKAREGLEGGVRGLDWSGAREKGAAFLRKFGIGVPVSDSTRGADEMHQWLKRQMGRAYKAASSGNGASEGDASARQMMGGY